MPFVAGVRWAFRRKDAGRVDSREIDATEDAASGRPARPGGTTCIRQSLLAERELDLALVARDRLDAHLDRIS